MMTTLSSDPVRILHITDPHLFANAESSLRGTVTYETLTAVLDHYRYSAWEADLILMTGDVVQDDTADAYERFKELLSPLGLPVVCVPGNHDVRPMMESALSVAPFSYCDTMDAGDWLLIGIDSCIDDDAGGFIRDSEMQRLADILHQTSASHVAVCLHHPPLPMQSKWLDEVGLRNSAEFLDLIAASGNVRLTLFGHVHQTLSAMYEGTQIIGTPSTCRQFMPGSDEFALDDKPPAYRRIELSADGTVSTELVWVKENT